jgi:hypothetical protein
MPRTEAAEKAFCVPQPMVHPAEVSRRDSTGTGVTVLKKSIGMMAGECVVQAG